MSELQIKQEWVQNPGSDPANPYSTVTVNCTGLPESHDFVGFEPEPWVIEVPDESYCTLKHANSSSDIETESSCGANVYVEEDVSCVYTSTVFNVSVPTLTTSGLVLLATLVLVVAWKVLD